MGYVSTIQYSTPALQRVRRSNDLELYDQARRQSAGLPGTGSRRPITFTEQNALDGLLGSRLGNRTEHNMSRLSFGHGRGTGHGGSMLRTPPNNQVQHSRKKKSKSKSHTMINGFLIRAQPQHTTQVTKRWDKTKCATLDPPSSRKPLVMLLPNPTSSQL